MHQATSENRKGMERAARYELRQSVGGATVVATCTRRGEWPIVPPEAVSLDLLFAIHSPERIVPERTIFCKHFS
jgi:hypothetical protein